MLYPGSPIKSIIIEYIAEETICSAKEIAYAVTNTLNRGISLQSIYKNLNNLEKQKIITKQNEFYTFTKEFFFHIQNFSTKLCRETKSLQDIQNIYKSISKRAKVEFQFQSLFESIQFCREIYLSIIFNNPSYKSLWSYCYHITSSFLESDKNFLEKIRGKIDIHSFVHADCEIDRHACKRYEAVTTNKIHLVKKKSYTEDTIIGDYIIHYENDPKHYSILTNFLKNISQENFPNNEFLYLYKFQYMPIKISIEKNKQKAENTKKLLTSYT